MDDVKIVRLVSGEDVIAFMEVDEDYFLLGSPMTVFFKRLPSGKAVAMMSPWIPMEIVEDDIISIHSSQILTVMQPKINIAEYYIQALIDQDETEEESLRDASQSTDDEYEEMIELFNATTNSNTTIH